MPASVRDVREAYPLLFDHRIRGLIEAAEQRPRPRRNAPEKERKRQRAGTARR
jgi:hypothetical protein